MLRILTVIVFCWLLWQVLKLAFKVSWGILKVVAWLLMLLAAPALILVLLLAGGLALLIPLAMLAVALLLLTAC